MAADVPVVEVVAQLVPIVFGATIGEVDVYPGLVGSPGVEDLYAGEEPD